MDARTGPGISWTLSITRSFQLNAVAITQTFQSTDIDTDKSLVCNKIKLQPQNWHRSKEPQSNTVTTVVLTSVAQFNQVLSTNLKSSSDFDNANSFWQQLKTVIYTSAETKQPLERSARVTTGLMQILQHCSHLLSSKGLVFRNTSSSPSGH